MVKLLSKLFNLFVLNLNMNNRLSTHYTGFGNNHQTTTSNDFSSVSIAAKSEYNSLYNELHNFFVLLGIVFNCYLRINCTVFKYYLKFFLKRINKPYNMEVFFILIGNCLCMHIFLTSLTVLLYI